MSVETNILPFKPKSGELPGLVLDTDGAKYRLKLFKPEHPGGPADMGLRRIPFLDGSTPSVALKPGDNIIALITRHSEDEKPADLVLSDIPGREITIPARQAVAYVKDQGGELTDDQIAVGEDQTGGYFDFTFTGQTKAVEIAVFHVTRDLSAQRGRRTISESRRVEGEFAFVLVSAAQDVPVRDSSVVSLPQIKSASAG